MFTLTGMQLSYDPRGMNDIIIETKKLMLDLLSIFVNGTPNQRSIAQNVFDDYKYLKDYACKLLNPSFQMGDCELQLLCILFEDNPQLATVNIFYSQQTANGFSQNVSATSTHNPISNSNINLLLEISAVNPVYNHYNCIIGDVKV
jgi:hypothetical protein